MSSRWKHNVLSRRNIISLKVVILVYKTTVRFKKFVKPTTVSSPGGCFGVHEAPEPHGSLGIEFDFVDGSDVLHVLSIKHDHNAFTSAPAGIPSEQSAGKR